MPRKAHEATASRKAEVGALRSFGVPVDEIAVYIGIDKKTLYKHYKSELEKSHLARNQEVGDFLYRAASGKALKDGASHSDCIRAAIFWAKTRMQWRETDSVGDAGDSIAEALTEIAEKLPD